MSCAAMSVKMRRNIVRDIPGNLACNALNAGVSNPPANASSNINPAVAPLAADDAKSPTVSARSPPDSSMLSPARLSITRSLTLRFPTGAWAILVGASATAVAARTSPVCSSSFIALIARALPALARAPTFGAIGSMVNNASAGCVLIVVMGASARRVRNAAPPPIRAGGRAIPSLNALVMPSRVDSEPSSLRSASSRNRSIVPSDRSATFARQLS